MNILYITTPAYISGVQISRYIANFGDRDIHLAIDMQQILAIVPQTVNTVHAHNSSVDIGRY